MDKMNEKLEMMLNSIGGLAEMSGIFLKEFLRNGFTREEAVLMISTVLSASINAGARGKEDK